MKLALISDIHSNYMALGSVLEDIKKQKNIEKISFLTTFHSQVMNTIISPIILADNAVGWVIVVEPGS